MTESSYSMTTLSKRLSTNSPSLTSASLFFIKPLERYNTEKPYTWAGPLDPSQEHLRTNIELEQHDDIPVRDVRPILSSGTLSLARNGFEILSHRSQFTRTESSLQDSESLGGYLTETADFLKRHLNAELSVCYNFKFRKSSPLDLIDTNKSATGPIVGIAEAPDLPIWPVHIDFTEAAGLERVIKTLTEPELEKFHINHSGCRASPYRVRIINSWRPLHRPVENAPLALCDAATVVPDDLIPIDRPTASQVSESYYLQYSPHHEFYWCSRQTPGEITFFTSWDSDPGPGYGDEGTVDGGYGYPFYCPHAAMRLPVGHASDGSGGSHLLRESVETRTVVVTKKQVGEGR